jgi:HK97 family phage portal protein
MNVFQKAVAWVADAAGANERITDPFDRRLWGLNLSISAAGQTVTSDSALQLDVVQSVLERLGGTGSELPLMIFRRTGETDADREEARDHRLFPILTRKPAKGFTHALWFDEQLRHLGSWRNAYAVLRPDEMGFPVGELEIVHPSRKEKIERGADGVVRYHFRRLPPAFGADVYTEDEVFHIRKAPLSINGLEGKPVWETGRETLGRAQAVEEFGAFYFANGGSGGGVLEHPGKFATKEDEEQFLTTWRSGGSGRNRHRDRLLKNGVKYTALQVKNDESQFIETKKEMGVSVCRIWNMPPHMAGLMDKATFSNIEQQSIEFVIYTLGPWLTAVEEAINTQLFIGEEQDEYFVEFNVAGLLKGDFKTRWAGYAVGRQWGWLSVNDVRRLEGMKPLGEEGDLYITPLNMVPAGSVPAPSFDPDEPDDPADDTPTQPAPAPGGK